MRRLFEDTQDDGGDVWMILFKHVKWYDLENLFKCLGNWRRLEDCD